MFLRASSPTPVLDADAADRRRGRCVSAFAARAASARTEPPRRVTLHVPAPVRVSTHVSRPRRDAFAAVVAGVAAEADADVDVAADAALDAAGDVEGVRERHERAARRVAAALTALAKPAAWDMCLTAGCDPEATTRLVSSSPFFRMTRERRGCDQTPVDDPAAKIYDVGRVEAARDVSNDAEEEEEEEEEDDDDAEVFDEARARGGADFVPADFVLAILILAVLVVSSRRRFGRVRSRVHRRLPRAGRVGVDGGRLWTASSLPFSSVEIAYQLVGGVWTRSFEHGASRASDRRLSVLEYSTPTTTPVE